MRRGWWVASLLVACSAGAPAEEVSPPIIAVSARAASSSSAQPSAQPVALTCPERVEVMRERLAAASERGGEVGVEAGITVPRLEVLAGEPVPAAPMIAVTKTVVMVDGQIESDVVPLLQRKRTLWKSVHPNVDKKRWDVVFTADAELPAKRLGELVGAVHTAGWTPWLMVRVPDYERVPRDPPPWVRELIVSLKTEQSAPSDKAARLADAMTRAIGTCAAVASAFAAVGRSIDPSDKGKVLAAELPAGVAGCDCRLDVDALEALIVETLAGNDARYRALPLPTPLANAATVQDLAKP